MKRSGRHLNKYRKAHPVLGKSPVDSLYGFFLIPVDGVYLAVISSGTTDAPEIPIDRWEHVSVTVAKQQRCPTWSEMCAVKSLFWTERETVLQFHPPQVDYINKHNYCLHLWRLVGTNHELPPVQAI